MHFRQRNATTCTTSFLIYLQQFPINLLSQGNTRFFAFFDGSTEGSAHLLERSDKIPLLGIKIGEGLHNLLHDGIDLVHFLFHAGELK